MIAPPDYTQIMAESATMASDEKQDEDLFVPFVINKRPKDDIPSPKPTQKKKVKIQVNQPDLALFDNMDIDGDKHEEMESEDPLNSYSVSVRRIIAVLDYYNALLIASESDEVHDTKLKEDFIDFCDKHYGEQMMLEDYMYFTKYLSDRKFMAKMASALKCTCSVGSKRCVGIRRHFRDRTTSLEPIHFYVDTMDTMHFNVLHLKDVGLRVNLDLKSESDENEDGLVDDNMLKLTRIIRSKRDQYFVGRLDDTSKNGKFSLCSELGKELQSERGRTEMDRLSDEIMKEAMKEQLDIKNTENRLRNFQKFRETDQYDTDTVHEDMKVFGEEGNSNVAERLKNDETFFISIRKILRYLRVSGSSFSTGKWFMYWDWYRTEEARKKMMTLPYFQNTDFGGHSVKSLCVDPHFKNFEEEVLSSGLISKKQWMKILEKATRFMKTSRCKAIRCNNCGGSHGINCDIRRYIAISLHHLIALLLYTDSSAFCTALSETFRAIFGGETIEEINKRNSRFYWSSRYLRELVTCFGFESKKEKKPFWSGISFPLQIPQFRIGLIGPTSTSMAKEVAMRFAGEQGLMIKLKGGESHCFNAVPFSCYPEEEERIFCGSNDREELVSIVMVETAKNYKAALSAFTAFDAIFLGRKVEGMKMSALDLEIIKESIRWIEGGEDAVNHKKLDLYILETFYSFILHKTKIYLNLWRMDKENEIINLVMNPLWKTYKDDEPEGANLMKPLVFNLFRHVHAIRIEAEGHPFDFLSFLRMLQAVDLPETLRLIIIEDAGDWINTAFKKVKVMEEYTAANVECKLVKNYFGDRTLYLKF